MKTQEKVEREAGNYPMPSTKINGFMEEFPWIRRYIAGAIDKAYVSVIESELLSYPTRKSMYSGELDEKLLLLDKEKEVVCRKMLKKYRKKYHYFGPLISESEDISGVVSHGNNLDSLIEKLGKVVYEVYWIVSFYRKTIIIYKFPKGVSLGEWMDSEAVKEKDNFKKEVEEI